jgi:hypothetical protein
MRHSHCLLLAVFSLAASAPACSQTPSVNSPSKTAGPVQQTSYTVELKTITVVTLVNGTTITRESSEIHAIDSQHRSLYSTTFERPIRDQQPVTMVHVEDPVEGRHISWNSQKQEATVVNEPPVDQRHDCWRSDSGRQETHYPSPRPASRTGSGAGVSGSISAVLAATSGAIGLNPPADIRGIGGGMGSVGAPAGSVPRLSHTPSKNEDLGTTTIEGVEVHGSRATNMIPAGQVGNDQPLVSTTESWTAPSLGISLRTVRDDPQLGKSTTEVVRLDLTEPPLSTFQPPDGYKIIVEEMHQIACQVP